MFEARTYDVKLGRGRTAYQVPMLPKLTVLNMGAGRQSVALLVLAIQGVIPKPDVVIHADTGHERKDTVRYIEQVIRPACQAAGIVFLVVSNGNIRQDTLASVADPGTDAKAIPRIANAPFWTDKGDGQRGAPLKRLCTSEYKVVPITRAIRELLGIAPGDPVNTKAHPTHVEQWIGIATEEAKRANSGKAVGAQRIKWSTMRYPLLELGLSTADCIEIIREHGWPVPVKSACVSCPYRSLGSWKRVKREDPDTWADAVDFDRNLRIPAGRGRINGTHPAQKRAHLRGAAYPAYLTPTLIPLGEIDFSDVDEADSESFGGEC